jgi:hypothetical protein
VNRDKVKVTLYTTRNSRNHANADAQNLFMFICIFGTSNKATDNGYVAENVNERVIINNYQWLGLFIVPGILLSVINFMTIPITIL